MHCELMISGLTKAFAVRGRQIVALQDIDLEVATGQFVTVIGPSGCGKSTLLRCIAGFERPTNGSVLVGGNAVVRPGTDRMMVFQGFDQLFPWLSALDNVALALRVTRCVSGVAPSRAVARRYLDLVGLAGYGDLYPHHLSGGMKQRVAIARALSVQPRILLMDEPFGSLDALTRKVLQEELASIWRDTGVTVLFVTHNIEEAIIQGDCIVAMSSQPGQVKSVIRNPLPRPRSPESPHFAEVWEMLHHLLGAYRDPAVGTMRARRRTTFDETEAPRLAAT